MKAVIVKTRCSYCRHGEHHLCASSTCNCGCTAEDRLESKKNARLDPLEENDQRTEDDY